MVVGVRFFASLRERVGRGEVSWTLADGATVVDLWNALCAEYPQIAPMHASMSFAVNREYVERDQRLNDGDEVALIPPVSGG